MMKEYDLTVWEKGLSDLDISLTEEQKSRFLTYYELLTEWNAVMNLTAITEFQEVVVKHFLDSLSLVKVSAFREKNGDVRLLDVGTGAGFPGIPLKIAFPELKVTLLDSLGKRVKFLQEVIRTLDLQEIEALHGRAEDYGKKKEYRESYDFCVSRAVANLSSLSEYCLPFVKVGGCFISYKSGKIEEEKKQAEKAVALLGGSFRETVRFRLADTDMERAFCVIGKERSTPGKYPRKAGTPAKEPL